MASFKERTDEFAASIKKNITSILLDVGIVGVAVAYIFYNILTFSKTDLDPWRLLMKGVIGIFVGVGLKWMLGEKGLIKGHNNENYIRPHDLYNARTEKAVPYIDTFDDFTEKERVEKTYRNRRIHLNNYKMKYETYFDKDGNYIEHEIWSPFKKNKYLKTHNELPEDVIVLDFRQRWCLRKCVRLQIYIPNVFSDYGDTITEDEKPEKTELSVRRKNTRSNFISAVLFALIGAYYVPDLLNFSWAGIIWSTFQVFMWLAFGIMNYYKNFTFVIIDEVRIIGKKEKLLTKFLIFALGSREAYVELEKKKEEDVKPQQQEKVIEMTEEEAKEKGLV